MPEPGSEPRAVVVGGSLAGLCAALALARDGWRVTVLERSAGEPPGGAGLGVDRELLGRVTGVDAAALPVIRGGYEQAAWGLVRDFLLDHVGRSPGVEMLPAMSATGVRELDDGIGEVRGRALVRAGGGEVGAELVVGADGQSSVVRRYVAPDHPHAAYTGYMLWRGLIEEGRVAGGLGRHGDAFAVHTAPGARLVGYGVPGRDGRTDPGRRRAAYAWYDAGRTDLLRRARCLEGDVVTGTLTGGQVPAGVIENLRAFAARYWPPPWDRVILHSLDRREVFGTPIAEYLPQRLVRGRVALVGDAAHVASPVTGAGFFNGLLDVAALAAAVRGAPRTAVPRALDDYQQQRLGRARRHVAYSMAWSRAYVSAA